MISQLLKLFFLISAHMSNSIPTNQSFIFIAKAKNKYKLTSLCGLIVEVAIQMLSTGEEIVFNYCSFLFQLTLESSGWVLKQKLDKSKKGAKVPIYRHFILWLWQIGNNRCGGMIVLRNRIFDIKKFVHWIFPLNEMRSYFC